VGADGKYVPGKKTIRWNNYTASISYRNTLKPGFSLVRWPKTNPSLQTSVDWSSTTNAVILPAFTSNDQLRLLSKLSEKVKGHSFNMAVSTAEAGKTVDMVVGNLAKLGRAALALRRGDFATAARQFGTTAKKKSALKTTDISGRWLELQYGWLPLLSDTYEGFKAYHALTSGPRKHTYRVVIKNEELKDGSGQPTIYKALMKVSRARYLQCELYEDLPVERSLGLMDPLTVAWEIVPYSFVVDWFVPIGTYLENLAVIPKLQGRFLTTDVFRQRGPTFSWHGNPFASSIDHRVLSNPSVEFRVTEMTRVLSGGLSVPLPSFDQGGLRGTRIKNAFALAYQAFSGRSGRK